MSKNDKEDRISDRVKIEGFVTIYQEDKNGNRTYLVKNAKNHFVDGGLKGLLSMLLGEYISPAAGGQHFYAWVHQWKMYLGTDTVTATTHGMTQLVSPIGTAPGTEPASTWGTNRANPSSGVWNFKASAQWGAGAVSGTVGELGLYFRPFDKITYLWTESTATKARVMVSRLSSADGDFTATGIDTSKTFTVEWEVRITYE